MMNRDSFFPIIQGLARQLEFQTLFTPIVAEARVRRTPYKVFPDVYDIRRQL
jgi:hypothetical protein